MSKIIDHRLAYWEFLRADNFSPILNEIGNFMLAWGSFIFMYYLNHSHIGVALMACIFIGQNIEAYYVGQEWLRNGKRVDMTKRYLLSRYGIR